MEEQVKEKIRQIVREAGKILLSAEDIASAVSKKEGFSNYVTEFDKKTQEYLIRELGNAVSGARFIGEEEGHDVFREENAHGLTFVIDPIDGTSNFIKGFRPSVISCGLLEDGQPLFGVVYNPYQDMLFEAQKGCGARLNGRPIHCSDDPLAKSLVIFGSTPYDLDMHRLAMETTLFYMDRCIDVRNTGTAAWDLCQVACGTSGLFFEWKLHLWDYAAGALIVTEAGGSVTDADGVPVRYRGSQPIFAASSGLAGNKYLPKDLGFDANTYRR
jgi:fructose-1,6-bisphosphatase/inositol monophosphatase family enzyme